MALTRRAKALRHGDTHIRRAEALRHSGHLPVSQRGAGLSACGPDSLNVALGFRPAAESLLRDGHAIAPTGETTQRLIHRISAIFSHHVHREPRSLVHRTENC
jgi:hypothetical protein